MRRSIVLLATAAAVALATTACDGSSGPAAGPIVIGATLPLTGDLAAQLGTPLEAGYRQEISDVNAGGGIAIGGAKEKLKLVVLDNAGNPSTASSQASQLVRRDHAVALLGPGTLPLVTSAALTAEQLRVPFVTSLTPVEAFANADKAGWKYSFDFFYDEQQQASDVAKALASVPSNKKVVLFSDSEPDAVAEQPLYKAAFKAQGLQLVGDYAFPVGATGLSSFVAQAKASGAQLLAGQMTSTDGVALWKQLKAHGFKLRAAFLAGAADNDSWWQALGSSAQDTISEGYWSANQVSSTQLAKISQTLGKTYAGNLAYSTSAIGYAAAEVLTGAIAEAGSTNSGDITAAISRANTQTTAGPVKFNQSTHTSITPYYITQWQDGKLVQFQPARRPGGQATS